MELETSLVFKAGSRTARIVKQRNLVLKNEKKKKNKTKTKLNIRVCKHVYVCVLYTTDDAEE